MCLCLVHFVIGTANKCDGINNAKVFILTSNRQSCAARIHLSPARSGTCSPNRTRTGQVLSQSQLLAMAKRRSSRMSCILCYFPTESTSSPSSSSCALLKLCSLSLCWRQSWLDEAHPRGRGQHLKCQCCPWQCIKFYRNSRRGLLLNFAPLQTKQMEFIIGCDGSPLKLLLNWKCMSNIAHKSRSALRSCLLPAK